MTGGALSLSFGAALVAAAELDSTLALQIMVSRPVVLGPLLGLLFGDPGTGLLAGVIIELLSHDKLPVGGLIPANATVSVGAAFLLARALPAGGLAVAVPAGLAVGWLHERLVDAPLRRRRGRVGRLASTGLRRGLSVSLPGLVARELVLQWCATLALLAACLLVLRPAAAAAWAWAEPRAAGAGLRFSLAAAPWLGAGMLAHSLRLTR